MDDYIDCGLSIFPFIKYNQRFTSEFCEIVSTNALILPEHDLILGTGWRGGGATSTTAFYRDTKTVGKGKISTLQSLTKLPANTWIQLDEQKNFSSIIVCSSVACSVVCVLDPTEKLRRDCTKWAWVSLFPPCSFAIMKLGNKCNEAPIESNIRMNNQYNLSFLWFFLSLDFSLYLCSGEIKFTVFSLLSANPRQSSCRMWLLLDSLVPQPLGFINRFFLLIKAFWSPVARSLFRNKSETVRCNFTSFRTLLRELKP